MSTFAQMVRHRVAQAAATGRLTNPHRDLEGDKGRTAAANGLQLVQQLTATNPAWGQDKDCQEVVVVLQVAGKGSPADVRTALTRLQRLLANLTAGDSDVAGDDMVQEFRRNLHLCLDH